jgi:hypothetical protein
MAWTAYLIKGKGPRAFASLTLDSFAVQAKKYSRGERYLVGSFKPF